MRFIYLDGPYTQFMGRMFAFKKATDVTDKATIEALLKNKSFMRVDDDKKEEQAPAAPAVLKRPVLTLSKRK